MGLYQVLSSGDQPYHALFFLIKFLKLIEGFGFLEKISGFNSVNFTECDHMF